jgi:hypothetical protein
MNCNGCGDELEDGEASLVEGDVDFGRLFWNIRNVHDIKRMSSSWDILQNCLSVYQIYVG